MTYIALDLPDRKFTSVLVAVGAPGTSIRK
jgi:hypothetical protein